MTLPSSFCRQCHREVSTDTSDTALQFLTAASPRGQKLTIVTVLLGVSCSTSRFLTSPEKLTLGSVTIVSCDLSVTPPEHKL